MKPLHLTEEHKKKLLEMCLKLFPERFHTENLPNYGLCTDFKIDSFGIFHSFPDNKEINFSIHWFEFVMTYLADKIFTKKYENEEDEGESTDDRIEFNNECLLDNNNHPIDYLYEEFKKLK